MSAVGTAALAAVKRRKLQTVVIGLVVMFSTVTIVTALALLAATSRPFERAFAQQAGAHVTATFDAATAGEGDLAATAELDGVEAAAGPYGQLSTTLELPGSGPHGLPVTMVGRDDPAGPVDRLDLWEGRWPSAAGEIVLDDVPNAPSGPLAVGDTVSLPDGTSLTIVGFAYSFSETAGAWVTEAQMSELAPVETQMLYRFTENGTSAEIDEAVAAIEAALPGGALVAAQSYLPLKEAVTAELGSYLVFLVVFGILGLAVAVLIVANVVSGAVVSGSRHIGVLKAIGFTPRQVVMVYLVMVTVPAVVGAVFGTAAGHMLGQFLLASAFEEGGLGTVTVGLTADAIALVGMPVLVLLAALVPALQAHRLSAAEAISAGSATHRGRALRIQRWLGGTRLPRAASLGLGLPFARPGRTAMTAAAVALGVLTATFAVGLAATVTELDAVTKRRDDVQVHVLPSLAGPVQSATALGDEAIQEKLAAMPGAANVTANAQVDLTMAGAGEPPENVFIRGDSQQMGYENQLLEGSWFDGPGETVVTSRFVYQHHVGVGDSLTLWMDGERIELEVVGVVMGNGDGKLYADWSNLDGLGDALDDIARGVYYEVRLEEGAAATADYIAAVDAAGLGLEGTEPTKVGGYMITIISLSTTLTVMLGSVAALGVFNTVVLNARERRRDLGMLKSIGMTPRQVVGMMTTSMAGLGLLGGVIGAGLGVLVHRQVVPLAAAMAQIELVQSLLVPWTAPILAALVLAGVAIAVAGAYLPARAAARQTIAEVLRNE